MLLGERGPREQGVERWANHDSYTGCKCNSIRKMAPHNYRDWRYRYLYINL